LTKEPLQAVLAPANESPRGKRDRALLLFGWASGGRRRSEIAGATLEDLRKVGSRGYVYTLTYSKTRGRPLIAPARRSDGGVQLGRSDLRTDCKGVSRCCGNCTGMNAAYTARSSVRIRARHRYAFRQHE
jgi:hypothetical protein